MGRAPVTVSCVFLLEIIDTEESDRDSTCYINTIIANILFEPEGGLCFEECLRMD